MSLLDRILGRLEDIIIWVVTGILAAMASGGLWFVRVVLTNQKQIELLRAELKHRDQLRAEDREDIAEIKGAVIKIHDRLIGDNDAQR